jgi:hypothetical protein
MDKITSWYSLPFLETSMVAENILPFFAVSFANSSKSVTGSVCSINAWILTYIEKICLILEKQSSP